MRISDWSSDVCSSDLRAVLPPRPCHAYGEPRRQRQGRLKHVVPGTHGRADPRRPAGGRRQRHQGAREGLFAGTRSEEHTSELQSLMRISYAVFCLKKKKKKNTQKRTKRTDKLI